MLLFDDDAEYINTDWLFDDSFIGFCSERVEREKHQKDERCKHCKHYGYDTCKLCKNFSKYEFIRVIQFTESEENNG